MKTAVCLVLSLVALAAASHVVDPNIDLDSPLESDEIIEAVNNAKTTWTAGRNFNKKLTKRYLKNLLGTKLRPEGSQLPVLRDNEEDKNIELPDNFDAREKWSTCTSLKEIKDQGPCGSCWAVSAAAAFTDRLCIAKNGHFNGHLSAEDLLTCCCRCAGGCGQGCEGGYIDEAWQHMMHTGICTGGDYKSKEGCQPYKLPPCEHGVPGPRKNCNSYGDVPTPHCQQTCYNKKYNLPKDQDLHKLKDIFSFGRVNKTVQKEILKYGPVQAGFDVYDDFFSYKSGVYQHTTGALMGGHAVKVLGWGVEDGTPYWLVANSWNTDWGDNGFFKILRGSDECSFESTMSAGHADV